MLCTQYLEETWKNVYVHIWKTIMTSSNWKIFRVAVLCVGNPPVTGRFPSQKDSNADLWSFFIVSMNTVKQTLYWPVIRDVIPVIWRRHNAMSCLSYIVNAKDSRDLTTKKKRHDMA